MSRQQWKKLTGFDAWSVELAALLDLAHAAAAGNDDGKRRAVARDLNDFVSSSWPNDEAVKELDAIALAASQALLLQNIGDCVAELMKRTGEYNRLTKDVAGITEALAAKAAAMRMERITKTIESTTSAIQALNDLSASLTESAEDKALGKALRTAIGTIEGLRSRVAGVI
jgi:hypothetical protein